MYDCHLPGKGRCPWTSTFHVQLPVETTAPISAPLKKMATPGCDLLLSTSPPVDFKIDHSDFLVKCWKTF